MFYALNESLGTVGRLTELPKELKNRRIAQVGPSWNNRRPPTVYATDDLRDFIHHTTNLRMWAIKLALQLDSADLTGWFWVDDDGNPMPCERA